MIFNSISVGKIILSILIFSGFLPNIFQFFTLENVVDKNKQDLLGKIAK